MIGNLLHDMGVGASDIRKIGDMPFPRIGGEEAHRGHE